MMKVSFTTIVIQEAAGLKISQASMARRLTEVWGQKAFLDAMLCQGLQALTCFLFAVPTSSYIPITMLYFSLALQHQVWDAEAWQADELHRHENFQSRKDIALCHRQSIYFFPAEVQQCIFPVFICPGGNCGHQYIKQYSFAKIPLPFPSGTLPSLTSF